jgi:predicted phage terminase large subunit-like protein
MQHPVPDGGGEFRRDWLRYYRTTPVKCGEGTTKYLLVDAANEKRSTSDYTSMWVIGLGSDGNYYVLDMLRDRLNLTQRAEALFTLHRRWKPQYVRYERYGMMADVQHIKYLMDERNYRFSIDEVAGQTPKNDRVRRLIPRFEQGKIWFPESLHYTDYEGKTRDLVHDFIEEEYASFPVALHDDMLDSLARIEEPDLPLVWPMQVEEPKPKDRYARKGHGGGSAWV